MAGPENRIGHTRNDLLLGVLLRAFGSGPNGSEIGSWVKYFENLKSSRLLSLMSREAQVTMEGFISNSSRPVDLSSLPSYKLADPIRNFDRVVKTRSPKERASSMLVAGSKDVSICSANGRELCKIQDVIVVPVDQPESFRKIHYWRGTEAIFASESMFSASPFMLMRDDRLIGSNDGKDHKRLIEHYLDAIGAIARPRQFGFVIPGDWPQCDDLFTASSYPIEVWIDSLVPFVGYLGTKILDSKHPILIEAIEAAGKRLHLGDRADDLLRRKMSPNIPTPINGCYYKSPTDFTLGNLLAEIYFQVKREAEKEIGGMLLVIGNMSTRKEGDIPPALIKTVYSSWPMSVAALFETQINQRIRSKLGIEPTQLQRMQYRLRRDLDRENLYSGVDY